MRSAKRNSIGSLASDITRQAKRDAKKLAGSGLKTKAQAMLELISEDPYRTPPPFEKLVGDLSGAISRRISNPAQGSLPGD